MYDYSPMVNIIKLDYFDCQEPHPAIICNYCLRYDQGEYICLLTLYNKAKQPEMSTQAASCFCNDNRLLRHVFFARISFKICRSDISKVAIVTII